MLPELKSPASGSTSSSKMVSQGEGLGLTATSGCFLGFLELEIKHKVKILMTTQVAYWSFPGPQLSWGLLDAKEHRRSSSENHRKAGDSPTRAFGR